MILFSKKPFNNVLEPRLLSLSLYLSSTRKSKIQKFAELRPERDARDEMAAKFRRINERRKNESLIKDFFTFPFSLWRSAWTALSIRTTFLESERGIDRLQRSLFYFLGAPLFAIGTDFFRTPVIHVCPSRESHHIAFHSVSIWEILSRWLSSSSRLSAREAYMKIELALARYLCKIKKKI